MLARVITSLSIFLTAGCCNDGIHPFTASDMCRVAEPDGATGSDTDPSGSSGEWGVGDCCRAHGVKFGGICEGVSDFDGEAGVTGGEDQPPTCFDCHWEPVLCMEQGCSTPNVADCCLNDDGQTVTCSPG